MADNDWLDEIPQLPQPGETRIIGKMDATCPPIVVPLFLCPVCTKMEQGEQFPLQVTSFSTPEGRLIRAHGICHRCAYTHHFTPAENGRMLNTKGMTGAFFSEGFIINEEENPYQEEDTDGSEPETG